MVYYSPITKLLSHVHSDMHSFIQREHVMLFFQTNIKLH